MLNSFRTLPRSLESFFRRKRSPRNSALLRSSSSLSLSSISSEITLINQPLSSSSSHNNTHAQVALPHFGIFFSGHPF
ncbi:hypothetical protein BB559_000132 [Furculomyces boomerangus]|uniref:Uncharacterized protein n=2 Tax=Harpellales TaxID=61421 RepID=A0A2T9Z697_9FUNG|nr:hypothetical protein BB559_000132 [Furculomyces boomerangus]PWA03366.1 hypothetical protein BB558_000475 [Smittium angustum]